MDKKRLLLHICCAPDSTVPWPELVEEGYETVGFFYGGNIHPESEYILRSDALKKFAGIIGERAIIADYKTNTAEWFEKTKEYKDEPERGKRCPVCFRTQLEAAAEYAKENGFGCLSTTLTISPHKDVELINAIGKEIAEKYGLTWLERVWRKKNGFKRSVEQCHVHGIFRQNYCGCIYSVRTEEGEYDGH